MFWLFLRNKGSYTYRPVANGYGSKNTVNDSKFKNSIENLQTTNYGCVFARVIILNRRRFEPEFFGKTF